MRRRAFRLDKQFAQKCMQSRSMRIGVLVLTVATGLFYVLQMNVSATKGYDIRELEQKISALQKENRQLELEASELQSVERLMAQLPGHRLVEARPDRFVTTSVTTFASR